MESLLAFRVAVPSLSKIMGLDRFDTAVYCSLSVLSICGSAFVLLTFTASKALRKHPSSILAWLSVIDIMMNYHTIPWALDTDSYISFFHMDSVLLIFTGERSGRSSVEKTLCYNNQIILSATLVASICYNIVICVDLILTLWNPFAPGYKRAKYYHVLALIVTVYCTIYLSYINGFAESCRVHPYQRMEISNSGTVGLLLCFYLFISIYSVAYTIYRFRTGLGIRTPIRIRYLTRHVAYVSAYCFCWIWPALSGLFHMIGARNLFVTEVAVVTTSLSGCLLSIIRSSEPLVWAQLRGLCKKRKYGKLEVNSSDDMCNLPFAECLTSEMSREVLRGVVVSVQNRMCEEREPGDFDYRTAHRLTLTDKIRLDAACFQVDSEFARVEIVEYAPLVFQDIRSRSGFTPQSLCESLDLSRNALSIEKAKESSGKSGSFMFMTQDRRVLVKTIAARERKYLQRVVLKHYHRRIVEESESMLCRFLGLFTLRISGVASVDILVMEGVLRSVTNSVRVYDLKGSQRATDGDRARLSTVFLDQDIRSEAEEIRVSRTHKEKLLRVLQGDVQVLAECGVMDYSFLLCIDETEGSVQSRNVYPSLDNKRLYHIGVIDLLTQYDWWKVVENKYKTLVLAKQQFSISAIRPDQYAARFLNFIQLLVVCEGEQSPFSLSSRNSRREEIELNDSSRK